MAAKKKTSPKKTSKVKAKTAKKPPLNKKAANKKTSSKKKTAAKTTTKKLSPLIKKLILLVVELNKEEIDFLISQAQTMKRIHDLISEQEQRADNHKMVVNAMNPVKDKKTIEIIEGEDESHFIIVLGNERNFFDRGEMKKIVKICHVASDLNDGMARLYTWFELFRGDVLNNNDISGVADKGLATIYKKILSTYTTQ